MLRIFDPVRQAVAESTFLELIYGPQKATWKTSSWLTMSYFFFLNYFVSEWDSYNFQHGILHTDLAPLWNPFYNAYFMICILKLQNLSGKKKKNPVPLWFAY